MNAPLTGGSIAGTIGAGVLFLLLVLAGLAFIFGSRGSYDRMFSVVGGIVCLVCAVITAGGWLWAMWPLAYEYHHWIPKSGTVERKVGSRLLGDGNGGINQKFVVVLHGVPYGVNDTRAATLSVGDHVSLKCKKAYDFGVSRSAQGWDCKWNGVTP